MIKYKIERIAERSYLVIQGQKGQQISEREYYALNTGQIPGLLKAELLKKGNSFKLHYNISGYISLREFLFNPLDKESFAQLLNDILGVLQSLQKAYFKQQYILMDLNATMLNPAKREICFVYVPITFSEVDTDLKTFLLSIIQCCTFVQEEDTDYVRDYIRILNNGINFSVFDLEEYIKRLNGNPGVTRREKKCGKCGAVLLPNVSFCSSCGMKIGGLVSQHEQGVYDPLRNITIPKADPLAQQPQECPVPPQEPYWIPPQQPMPQPAHYGTSVAEQSPNQQQAYLYRVKNGERISLVGEYFRLGKDPSQNEYCIRDNTAVSRSHAALRQKAGRWYIMDLKSTNKTFVNNVPVMPGQEVLLNIGTSLRLANEEFQFLE
jgi:hypothetical protein